MPFKGDMRLGGPHDNEASLNGTSSDFSGVPAYGTVLSSGDRPIYVNVTEIPEQVVVGTEFYDVIADGLGGSLEANHTQSYISEGTQLTETTWGYDSTSSYNEYTYRNGQTYYCQILSNGNGGYTNACTPSGDFKTGLVIDSKESNEPNPPSTYVSDAVSTWSYDNLNYTNGKQIVDTLAWDGNGGLVFQQAEVGSYYTDGTFFADADDTSIEVPQGSGSYYFDGNDNRWEWDGAGNIVFRYSGLYPDGTFITNYEGTDYFWDGNGGYRT